MKEDFSEQIEEAVSRIKNGALPKELLKEYMSIHNLQTAFHIVMQAQIKSKNKLYTLLMNILC